MTDFIKPNNSKHYGSNKGKIMAITKEIMVRILIVIFLSAIAFNSVLYAQPTKQSACQKRWKQTPATDDIQEASGEVIK